MKNANGKGTPTRRICAGCFVEMAEQEEGMQLIKGNYFHAGKSCVKKYERHEERLRTRAPLSLSPTQPPASTL